MKKYIFYLQFTLCLLSNSVALGQIVTTVCDADYQPTRTDSLNPFNANLPNIPIDSFFLSGLNWNASSFPLPYMMFNNIVLGPKPGLVYLSMPDYYDYLYWESPAHKHPSSEGWEVLLANLGYYPDNQNINPSTVFSAIPYIVLYNRYKGIIRVFVGMSQDTDPSNSSELLSVDLFFTQASFEGKHLSGLLRLYKGEDRALDQVTETVKSVAVTRSATEKSRWSTVDFQVAYDPCSCNTPSNIKLDFHYIRKQGLSLYGRSVGVTDNNILDNELGLNPNQFLSGFDGTYASQQEKHGLVIDKSLKETINQYEKRYEKYLKDLKAVNQQNEKVKRNLAILKFAKAAIAISAGLPGGLSNDFLPEALKTASFSYALAFLGTPNDSLWDGSDDADWFGRTINGVQGIVKKVNGEYKKLDEKILFDALAKVFGDDASMFISKNFKQQAEPTKPDKPGNTVTYTEMTFLGSLTSVTDKTGPTFVLPGSFGENRGVKTQDLDLMDENNVFSYPTYNESLGTFALLNTPSMNLSSTIHDEFTKTEEFWEPDTVLMYNPVTNLYEDTIVWYINSGIYQNWTRSFQMKLDKDLKYVYNPVLDIDGVPVLEASWRIEAKQKNLNPSGSQWANSSYIDPTYTSNVEAINFDLNKYQNIYGNDMYWFNEGNHPLIQFDETNNGIFPAQNGGGFSQRFDSVILITPFFPIDAFQPLIPAIGIKNEYINAKRTAFFPGSSNYPSYVNGSWVFPNISSVPHLIPAPVNYSNMGYTFDNFNVDLKLKMKIDYLTLRDFDDEPNTLTQVLSYSTKVNSPMNVDIFPNLEGSNLDFQAGIYQKNLQFDSVYFNSNPVQGCVFQNNHYTCKAWENVSIVGDLYVSNGITVDISGGNEVTVSQNAIVNPEINLFIDPVLNTEHPMSEANITFVENYCNKWPNEDYPPYLANSHGKNVTSEEIYSVTPTNYELLQRFEFSEIKMFPNPATRDVSLQLNRDFSILEVNVFDVTGRRTEILIHQINSQNYKMDISKLKKGVYFVKITSTEGTITKNLVVK